MFKRIHINSSDGVNICVDIIENCDKNIFVWPSSLVLSAYLVSNAKLCERSIFYEIGAGCGLPALVAAKLGASKCYVTEKDNDIQIELLKTNVCRNGLDNICHVRVGNWGENISNTIKCDFILGSDVFYSSEDFDIIITTVFSILSKNPHAIFLTSYHQRRYAFYCYNCYYIVKISFLYNYF